MLGWEVSGIIFPPAQPHTPPGSIAPDISDLQCTIYKVTIASKCATFHTEANRITAAAEMEKHISGTPVDSWLELWLPGKDLDLDNLPEEFSNKKFHFQDLIFDSKKKDSIKNESQLYPKLVRRVHCSL